MASPPVIEDPAQASRRARVRVGVAVTLLVTAVGILAMLNQHKTSHEPVAESPQAPSQTSISSQETEKPAESGTPEVSGMSSPPMPEPASEPETTPPPPPPVPGTLPVAEPPKPHPAPMASAEKTGGQTISTKPEPMPQPAKTVPAIAPTKTAEPVPALEPTKSAPPKSFEVQLGVFSDMENAKQLQAKLAEHGIPSHTETRVQVGPFKTRAEADQAREKLKALGITSVIAPK